MNPKRRPRGGPPEGGSSRGGPAARKETAKTKPSRASSGSSGPTPEPPKSSQDSTDTSRSDTHHRTLEPRSDAPVTLCGVSRDLKYRERGILAKHSDSTDRSEESLKARALDWFRRMSHSLFLEQALVEDRIMEGKSLTRANKEDVLESCGYIRSILSDASEELLNLVECFPVSTEDQPDLRALISEAVQTEVRPALESVAEHVTSQLQPQSPEILAEAVQVALQQEMRSFRDEFELLRETVREEIKETRADLLTAQLEAGLQPPNYPMQSTFAEIAALPKTTTVPQKSKTPRPAVFIRAFDKNDPPKDPQAAIAKWKQCTSFRGCGFAPERVIPIKDDMFKVEFETAEMAEQLVEMTRQERRGVRQFQASLARRKNPLVILKGIPVDVPSQDLISIIEGQNPIENLRLCYLTANRNPLLYNAVIEVSPETRQRIIELGGRLGVEHQKVHVSDQTRFVQCFACLGFGHTRAKCTNEKVRPCSFCASKDHQYATCPKRSPESKINPVCFNCKNAKLENQSHSATDRVMCPLIIAEIARADSGTSYEAYPSRPNPIPKPFKRTPSPIQEASRSQNFSIEYKDSFDDSDA